MKEAKKILIVDDLEDNLRLYSIIIKQSFPNVQITTTSDSRKTFELVEREQPDLIVLDAMMPEMDGFEVCAKIKGNPETASILILMVSAVLVDSKNRATGLNVGADGYLCKPFEKQELIAQVQAFFRIRESEVALREARRNAEYATETKSRFLAQMSHEIRTPMNAVIGMTDIILGTELTSDQRDMTETIRQSGESLLRIINDILDFSKIESGKLDIHKKEFLIGDCVEAVTRLLAYSAQNKGIELAYWIDERVPETIYCDYDRLRQVLVNLAGNAVKFTNEGEVFIKIELDDRAGSDETWLRFSVRDTGIGIPAKDQKLLFEPFTQVDLSSTRRFEGSGLGLAISKRIVAMLGGEMQLESEEGHGSTFFFTLPVQPKLQEDDLQKAESIAELKKKRLLAVDDNDTNRQILRSLAQKWGMRFYEAVGAEDALRLLEKEKPFDIILLDMHMPEVDGLMLARQIRDQEKFDDIPIVILTSMGDPDNVCELGVKNISSCLQKPIRPRYLLESICKALNQPYPDKAERAQESAPPTEQSAMAEDYPYRILLAEDNVVNRKVAEKMVGKLGYDIESVENGSEALERIRNEDYDIVFMDMQMPVMDGWEATQSIRSEIEPERQPYIIAMTAGAMDEDREKCFEAGLDAFVPKPIRMEKLVGALKAAKSGERYGER